MHAASAYETKPDYIQDALCGLAFPDMATMFCHDMGPVADWKKGLWVKARQPHRDDVLSRFSKLENIVLAHATPQPWLES